MPFMGWFIGNTIPTIIPGSIILSREVMNFLRRLCDEAGHSIVIITHEMPIVAQYAERTVVFGRGHILLDGPRRDVFSQPDILKQTYVEPPQITRLDQVLRAECLPPDILTVEEMQQFFEQTMPV
jgi:energy-coupling factor transport system ATP-binding protein